ncbi:MAG: hypothetical protein JXA82_06525 [Sedimentisphaerales bacterium]|nr:hypothetical protein [Sedimentisphaerales bacterium]
MGKKKESLITNDMDATDILIVLHDIGSKEIKKLIPYIPTLLKHKSWLVRSDILDYIGIYELKQFRKLVLQSLKDPNKHVISYGLMAYYELSGKSALPILRRYTASKYMHVRITALCLAFVETRDKQYMEVLRKIVFRKNCKQEHKYIVINVINYFMEIKSDAGVLSFCKELRKSNRGTNLYPYINSVLAEK